MGSGGLGLGMFFLPLNRATARDNETTRFQDCSTVITGMFGNDMVVHGSSPDISQVNPYLTEWSHLRVVCARRSGFDNFAESRLLADHEI